MSNFTTIPFSQINIRYTADLVCLIPTAGYSTCTVQLDDLGATTWGMAVVTIKRSNRPTGPWYALETTGAGINTIGPGGGMSGTINVSGCQYLGLFVTTAEGGGADKFILPTVCLKG